MQNDATYTLKELATHLSATICGDENIIIHGICPLDEPRKDAIAFSKDHRIKAGAAAEVGALIVSSKVPQEHLIDNGNFIICETPYDAIVALIPLFYKPHLPKPGISSKSDIAPSARIGTGVHVGAFSVIGENSIIEDNVTIYPNVIIYPDVHIGEGSVIHSGAVIREGSKIGKDSVIQNGAVIGGDGFGYVPDPVIGLRSVPQVGHVILGDRVDVGANACIDRATLGTTRVGPSSKIDNLVQVGHNTKIGTASILCGQVGVAGSVNIGNRVVLGGAVGVSDHLEIVDGVRVTARSAVTESIPKTGDYGGIPAIPLGTHRRNQVALRRLGDFVKEVRSKLEPKE